LLIALSLLSVSCATTNRYKFEEGSRDDPRVALIGASLEYFQQQGTWPETASDLGVFDKGSTHFINKSWIRELNLRHPAFGNLQIDLTLVDDTVAPEYEPNWIIDITPETTKDGRRGFRITMSDNTQNYSPAWLDYMMPLVDAIEAELRNPAVYLNLRR